MFGSPSLDFTAAPLSAEALAELPLCLGISGGSVVRDHHLLAANALRDALARCFVSAAHAQPLPTRDLATINSFASDEPPAMILGSDRRLQRTAIDPVSGALCEIARDAISVIASSSQRLRACERVDCATIFLDVSRSGRRRWCSMQLCGNREKVAGYRSRRQFLTTGKRSTQTRPNK
jgi:predicted RNA-binding Zn ribbon-like protein